MMPRGTILNVQLTARLYYGLYTTIGTQVPYAIDYLIVAIVSQPVAWLGLLGAALLVADRRCLASKARALASFTLLLWAVLLFAASRTPLSGFPQRFGRDLGVPLAVLAAFALVTMLWDLWVRRKLATVLVAPLAVDKRREDETLRGRDTRSASGGEGWFRLVPVGGYALAQTLLLQAFLERGVSRRHGLWWLSIPDFAMFLYVFVPTMLPALVTDVVDGVEEQVSKRVPISSHGCSVGTPTGGLPLEYLLRKRATGLVAP